MAVLLVFWSLIYGLFYHAIGGVGVWDYILNFSGTLYPHIWYMYMIIGLYLITPVLRLFVKRENSKYILYFIILSVCANYVPAFMGLFQNIFVSRSLHILQGSILTLLQATLSISFSVGI